MARIKSLLINILSIPLRLFTKISPFAFLVKSSVDKKSAVSTISKLYNSSIGEYTIIGRNCFRYNVSIGRFCSIADGYIIGAANHPSIWVSTSPVFIKEKIFSGKISKCTFMSHTNRYLLAMMFG